jgi:hypothetical protein
MNHAKYVGTDARKSITVIVVLNEPGQFESRSQIRTKGEIIRAFFRGISGGIEAAFEEGEHPARMENFRAVVFIPDYVNATPIQASSRTYP